MNTKTLAGFTPGPWKRNGHGIVKHPVTNATMITNRIETSLGSFEILDETNEPEFNAALIAQAPYLLRQRNELLAALKDADYLLRKLAVNWKEAGSMRDSAMRSSEDARAIIASVEGK